MQVVLTWNFAYNYASVSILFGLPGSRKLSVAQS